eukprot:TRINITY_DN57433_c0_g1_i1.p1 TRINITY_DN57433_c0_g1~~TRINITY_DN57433_c0_g1_i1.p1  ORF type:complete len:229 (-),score=23.66 TRINITY_DN57433_c0_g1_i1:296-982(-)
MPPRLAMNDAENSCELLGPFGLFVQCLLAVTVLLVLLLAWCCERSRRSTIVFILDAGKITFGAAYVHLLNILQALLFTTSGGNQCAWYLVGVFCDCVLSTCACYFVVRFVARPLLRRYFGIEFGHYEASSTQHGKVDCRCWLQQTLIWCVILTAVRACLAFIVWLKIDSVYAFGVWALSPAGKSKERQLIFSLVIMPVMGDVFQFLMQDRLLKKDRNPKRNHSGGLLA